jgi:hypothetical protein
MLHACDQRFDVTGNLENFCELNKASGCSHPRPEDLCPSPVVMILTEDYGNLGGNLSFIAIDNKFVYKSGQAAWNYYCYF